MRSRAFVWTASATLLIGVGVTSWVIEQWGSNQAPNADASGLFPSHVAPISGKGGSASLISGWASLPNRRSFDVTIPARRGGEEFYILCDHGQISLDFGGAIAGGACSGSVRGVIGNPFGPSHKTHVHVTVDSDQTSRWGLAVYTTN